MNELMHHGIKGQKWYNRRFQYKDGSLTPAGKKRYGSYDGKGNRVGSKAATKAQAKNAKKAVESTPKTKPVSKMTDAELKAAIARKKLENEYRELNPKQVSAGEKFVKAAVDKVIVPVAVDVGKDFTKKAFNKVLKTGTNTASNDKKKKKD